MGQICTKFEILMCNCICIVYVFLCIGTLRTVLFQGGGECNTSVLTPFALNVCDVYILINHGVELKAKSPPSIWLCYVSANEIVTDGILCYPAHMVSSIM